jgi:hypothetical protein
MQTPLFRDILWAVTEASDRSAADVEGSAFLEVTWSHPGITRSRFDEVIDMLVRTEHLRRWGGTTENGAGPRTLMPTAKARLQFSAAVTLD